MTIKELHHHFLKSAGVCTDTRKIRPNVLFFALKGDSFNGNTYALQAIENGASFAIIDDSSLSHPKFILVDDALKTLQDLAHFHRNYLNIPIIALTGSNGKTTTKELIQAVLSTKFKSVATIGNLNNHIGVPLTLLNMDTTTEIGIVEMGANHMHEIEGLCNIATPNFGYITNIGKAHLEGFGSEENILIGKCELYDHLKETNGIVFCNAEDEKLSEKAKNLNAIYFSNTKKSDHQILFISDNPFISIQAKSTTITTNLIGAYNFTNIAASIAIGLHFNISIDNIKKGLENYIPNNNRSQLIKTNSNELILDAYNANPSSMLAALKSFENIDSKLEKTAILGDMFELGDYAKVEHQAIIDYLSQSNINRIYLAGENFTDCTLPKVKFKGFHSTAELAEYLTLNKIKNQLVLIKGSRGMTMEKIAEVI